MKRQGRVLGREARWATERAYHGRMAQMLADRFPGLARSHLLAAGDDPPYCECAACGQARTEREETARRGRA
jgi:hypothetical protein